MYMYMCMYTVVSTSHLSMIFLFDFWNVPTMWFVTPFYCSCFCHFGFIYLCGLVVFVVVASVQYNILFVGGSCLIFVIYVLAHSCVQHILCCVVFFCFVCLHLASCVSSIASLSGLSILDNPFGFHYNACFMVIWRLL